MASARDFEVYAYYLEQFQNNGDIGLSQDLTQVKFGYKTLAGVRGVLSRARKALYQSSAPVPKRAATPPLPPQLANYDDRPAFRERLQTLLDNQRYVRIMHPCDIHQPYHDESALRMFYMLMELVQPDIVVRGSDEDDLPTISHYVRERGDEVKSHLLDFDEQESQYIKSPEAIDEFLAGMYSFRRLHTERIKMIVPDAIQVNIEGNHGWRRFNKWVNMRAREAKKTLTWQYINNVRCDGDVYWIGSAESVRIGDSLLVMHGKKHTKHAALGTLELRNKALNIMAGHTHRPDMYTVVGERSVTCVISGCLCQLPEPYAEDEDDLFSTHQQGTAVGLLDTYTGMVDLVEVRFHRHGTKRSFVWGNRVYEFDEADDGQHDSH